MMNFEAWDQEDVRVPLRLSQTELSSISLSLGLVSACYRAARSVGRVPDCLFLRTVRPPEMDGTRFDEPLMRMILGLSDLMKAKLSSPQGRYRLRCHAYQLAAMSFSMRLMTRQFRHGHIKGAFQIPDPALLRKIEKYRRRALRRARHVSAAKEEELSVLQVRWHRLQRWVSFCLFHCQCHRPSPYPGFRRRRQYVAIASRIATEAIRERNCPLPTTAILHAIVRRVFRYARMGRIAYSIRDLIQNTPDIRNVYYQQYRITRQ